MAWTTRFDPQDIDVRENLVCVQETKLFCYALLSSHLRRIEVAESCFQLR
jgi:hypothetical protein